MTSISSAFGGSAALRLLMGSTKASTSQNEVDKIVEIIRSSPKGTFAVDASFNGAQIDTTDGDETDDSDIIIGAFHDARIATGGGDDDIGAYSGAQITSGSGNDHVTTYSNGVVSSGAGNDYVYGYSYMSVDAGDGNDEVRTSGHSTVNAGNGNDLVVTLGYSQVDGGAGNDTLIAVDVSADHSDQAGHATLSGGEGDDDIQIGRNSVANGGTGNDKITLAREGSTVEFAKGDGQDKIFSEDDFALAISGYSKDDVTLTEQDGNVLVSFAGSDDTLTINLREGKAATVSFSDGSEMTIGGANNSRGATFNLKWTSPEWRNAAPYQEFSYSRELSTYRLPEEYVIS